MQVHFSSKSSSPFLFYYCYSIIMTSLFLSNAQQRLLSKQPLKMTKKTGKTSQTKSQPDSSSKVRTCIQDNVFEWYCRDI